MNAVLTPMGIDETHAECVERARRSSRRPLRPQPADHDAHVTAWRIWIWDKADEVAWLARQEQKVLDND